MTCKESTQEGFSSSRIKAVALHEIGHSLGLLGHSPVPEDIMYCAEGLAEAPQNLTERDKKTMKLLYSWQPQ
jgi:predicted Zn-dependent protease